MLNSITKANASFRNQALRNLPQNHNVKLLGNFQDVTKEDVLDSLKVEFLPLFDAKSSVAVVVTPSGKVDAITKDLESLGFEVERRQLNTDEESTPTPESMEMDRI